MSSLPATLTSQTATATAFQAPTLLTSALSSQSTSLSSRCTRAVVSPRCPRPSSVVMAVPPHLDPSVVHWHKLPELASNWLIATKGDIGPITNVDLESVGLLAAISGGSLVAGLIVVFIMTV